MLYAIVYNTNSVDVTRQAGRGVKRKRMREDVRT
jgi:hypothetical protein